MPRCKELPAVGWRVTGEVVWHAGHNHQVGMVLDEWAEHEDLLPRFRVGQVVVGGRVTKIASIGVFVRLADCLEGLLPLTEPPTPADSFYEGQELSVRIVTIDHERRRVLLSEAVL